MKFAVRASAALLAVLPLASGAVQLTTAYTSLGGTRWQVDLHLVDDDGSLVSAANPGGTISEFTVFFPHATTANLQSLASPAAWGPLAIQPDSSPSDGYVDYLITPGHAALAIGQGVGGLSIAFSASGGVPGSLVYDVVDPNTFATLYEGHTISAVPESATWASMLLGLGALRAARRSRRTVAASEVS